MASTEQLCLISLKLWSLVRLSADLTRVLTSCELQPLRKTTKHFPIDFVFNSDHVLSQIWSLFFPRYHTKLRLRFVCGQLSGKTNKKTSVRGHLLVRGLGPVAPGTALISGSGMPLSWPAVGSGERRAFLTSSEYYLRTWAWKAARHYTGWPKKVSHYKESPLNRIKNRQCVIISHQFWV